MITKTYGIEGMIDFVAALPAGRATLNVHFTGGAMTAYGVTPAEFTSSNPAVQSIIEASAYYRSGRIRLQSSTDDGEPVPPYRPEVIDPATAIPNDEAEVLPETKAKAESANEEAAKPSPSRPNVVKVTCVADATTYLRENYNIPTHSCRTIDAAKKSAAALGITFEGI